MASCPPGLFYLYIFPICALSITFKLFPWLVTCFIECVSSIPGLLIVHPYLPQLPEHHITVGDWTTLDSHTVHINDLDILDIDYPGTGQGYTLHDHRSVMLDGASVTTLEWDSGLVNGRGRYESDQPFPLTTFRVVQGQQYRFRMVNVGSDFPLKVSIDGHRLRLVATDGYDVEPILFDMIKIQAGETIDFEMWANSTVDRYWFRANTDSISTTDDEIRAVVIYAPLEEGPDPTSQPTACTEADPCLIYNCLQKFMPSSYNQTCVNVDEIRTLGDYDQLAEQFGLADENVREIFLDLSIQTHYGPSINARRFETPSGPFFQGDTGM